MSFPPDKLPTVFDCRASRRRLSPTGIEVTSRTARFALLTLIASCCLTLASCDNSESDQLRTENEDLDGQIEQQQSQIEALETALAEANEQISQAASDISEAQDYFYGDCSSLRTLVQSMNQPDEVGTP